MKYNYTDLGITEDGDLDIEFGDTALFGGIDGLVQAITFRMKTELGDMFIQPNVGNDLKELIGQRNTKEVADRGRASIIKALTYGNLIDPTDITVTAIPANPTTILFHTEIKDGLRVIYKFDMLCDLENGIRRI